MAGDDRVQQTCAYLRMLLLRPGEYRAAWERLSGYDSATLDVAAVAGVLGAPPDTVRRALDGEALTPQLLHRFVDAFAMRPRHAERLAGLLSGSPAVRVINDEVRVPAALVAPPDLTTFQTLSLHELHTLGPDGRPAEHQTIQLIRSTVDGLTSLPYRFDTDELIVEVVRGGSVGDVYRLSDTLYAVDILLTSALARGETALMQYRTNFFYRSAPPPEFRRGVLGGTQDLTMWVTFHPARVPRRVWQARWDAIDHARITHREEVRPDDEHSVHCRFDAVERAIVGFYWEWD